MQTPRTALILIGLVALILALVGAAAALVSVALAQTAVAEQDHLVYLPLILSGGEAAAPPPEPVSSAFFVDMAIDIGSSDIVVDDAGRLHLAFAHYTPTAEQPAAVYVTCLPGPSVDCANSVNWEGVSFLEGVNEVQLALTAAGQPRLLIRAASTTLVFGAPGNDFYYVACDQNCTDPMHWFGTYILSNHGTDSFDVTDLESPQRSFALDPQGRPRFVYQDRNYFYAEPDHYGAYYVFCDQNCTDQANWYEVQISAWDGQWAHTNDIFKYPSLTFSSSGQPRLLTAVVPGMNQPEGIYYLACDDDCGDSANWQRVWLFERGSGVLASWDLALDGKNRPRVAFYKGEMSGDNSGERLYYAWCDANCLNVNNWQQIDLGLDPGSGKHPDLALDENGRPRIAYIHQESDGLGYAWCDQSCADPGQWWYQVVENHDVLQAEFPVPLPGHCDAGLWNSMTPVLSLGPDSAPHIAYDVEHRGRCLYQEPGNPAPPYYRWEHILWTVRVVSFPQP